jgi:hypothetical protein
MEAAPEVSKADRFAPLREARLFAHFLPHFARRGEDIDSMMAALNTGFASVMEHYNEQISALPVIVRPKNASLILNRVVEDIQSYQMFNATGRNIFGISPSLAEEFEHTDVDEVHFDDLFLPYDSFYVGFGPRAGLKIRGDSFIDGAYIMQTKEGLHVKLTTYNPQANYSGGLNMTQPLSPQLSFEIPVKPGATISSGIEEMLKQEGAKRVALDARPRREVVKVEKEGGGTVTLLDSRPEFDKMRAADFDEGVAVLRSSLNLVVNSLCFISSFPKQIDHQYRQDVPQELLRDAGQVAPAGRKERRAKEHALRVMETHGYTKLHWCTDEVKDSPGTPTGREVSAHWRRGHWRRQPHGTGLEETRLIRIRPTLVRRDKGDPAKGHVYEVGKSPSPKIPSVPMQLPAADMPGGPVVAVDGR